MRARLLALLFLPGFLAASPLPDYPFVYVQGTASRALAPDQAHITFHIKTFDTQAERAYRAQSDAADALLTFTGKLGIQPDAIVAQAIEKSSVRKQDDKGNDLEIIGYNAERRVEIDVGDLALFPKLIEFLYVQSSVEEISVNFGRKDQAAIMQSLTEEAGNDASQKAQRLCKGFGQKPKRVRAISEGGFGDLNSPFGFNNEVHRYGYLASNQRGGQKDFRVIPATIPFVKSVFAVYEIE